MSGTANTMNIFPSFYSPIFIFMFNEDIDFKSYSTLFWKARAYCADDKEWESGEKNAKIE